MSEDDSKVVKVNVEYKDTIPQKATVKTRRRDGDYLYYQEYRFVMEGSSAVLSSIDADGDAYPVRSNKGTRKVARMAVGSLPFVQAVSMFPEVEE